MQLYRPRRKTAHRDLQWLFLLFAVFCPCCLAVHPAILHRLRNAGAHHSAATPPPIPDTTAAPDAVQLSTAALL
nr:MAG TPA: SOX transcription factor [Caudoviricetes sp.]